MNQLRLQHSRGLLERKEAHRLKNTSEARVDIFEICTNCIESLQ